MAKLRRYLFTVQLSGIGKDADSAWEDAVTEFGLEAGPTPPESEYEYFEESDEGEKGE